MLVSGTGQAKGLGCLLGLVTKDGQFGLHPPVLAGNLFISQAGWNAVDSKVDLSLGHPGPARKRLKKAAIPEGGVLLSTQG